MAMRYLCLKLFFLFCVVGGLLVSCRDDESTIAEYPVYVKTSYSEYQELKFVNRAVIYKADGVYATNFQLGFGGICIFRDFDNRLGAFDLACPYENLRTVCVEVEMPYATCPQCKSKYDLSYGLGNPVDGPSKSVLKVYTKIVDRGDYIVVTN